MLAEGKESGSFSVILHPLQQVLQFACCLVARVTLNVQAELVEQDEQPTQGFVLAAVLADSPTDRLTQADMPLKIGLNTGVQMCE